MSRAKVTNESLVKCAAALATAGYSKKAAATMLGMSDMTLLRFTWLYELPEFGKKKLPKLWVEERQWIKKLPVNLRPTAKKIEQWVHAVPELPVEMILARYQWLDRETASKWLISSYRSNRAMSKIETLTANLCKTALSQ